MRHNPGTAKVLQDAVTLLETDGWTRGVNKIQTGEHCILGAIAEVPGNYAQCYEANHIVMSVLGLHSEGEVAEWNDAQDSVEPVIKVLHKAARRVQDLPSESPES